MPNSKSHLFNIAFVLLSTYALLRPFTAQALQDDESEAGSSPEAPAITLHTNSTTLDAATNAQQVRSHFEEVRSKAQQQTRAKLLRIDEDARLANEEMASHSSADWQQAQSDYLNGLKKLRELDLDAKERRRREAELAAAKDKRLETIAAEREQRARKIQADREARRASAQAQAAEFNTKLQEDLSTRVDLVQSGQRATSPVNVNPATKAPTPELPDPRVYPKTPGQAEAVPPKKTMPAMMVDSQLATTPKFDINISGASPIQLLNPRLRGALLKADSISFDVILKNAGEETFAFADNQIDVDIIEGFLDYRQRVEIDRRGVRFYPARGRYDIAVQAAAKVQVPLVIKGPRQNRVGLWPVPMPNRYGAGLRAVRLSSGEGPVELKPDVWHTMSIRLVPAAVDEVNWNHKAFANIRFDRQGGVQEMKGPFIY